jgi:hypothetical protein
MGANASKNKITSQDKAILDLKVQRDKLKKYQKNVRKSRETFKMKTFVTNDDNIKQLRLIL